MVKISEIGTFDGLSCGMPLREVFKTIGVSHDAFKRNPSDESTIYTYDEQLMHITVNDDEIVEVISVFQPREVQLKDISLLGRNVHDVVKELREAGFLLDKQDVGYFIPDFRLLLVEVDNMVDGIEIYK